MLNLNLVGIDEAGRGAIAGPLVVASFLLIDNFPSFIRDSKKLKEDLREEIFDNFLEKRYFFGVGIISNIFIDNFGILKAFKEGVKLSLSYIYKNNEKEIFNENFFINFDYRKNYSLIFPEDRNFNNDFLILIDGNLPVIKDFKTIAVVDGDDRIKIISSASIVAKVIRDRIMRKLCKDFNNYDLSINKGYCTLKHLDSIKNFGLSNCHRKTFYNNLKEECL